MEPLYMRAESIPDQWRENLASQHSFVRREGVVVWAEQDKKTRTLSVVLLPDEQDRKRISERLGQVLSEDLGEYLVWQPWQGYHFSVQWVPEKELRGMDEQVLIDEIECCLGGVGAMDGKMVYPLLGRKNLFGVFDVTETDRLAGMREGLEKVWRKHGWDLGVPEGAYGLAWMSLLRFKKEVPEGLLAQLEGLEPVVDSLAVSRVRVSVNDEFLSPDKTRILKDVNLVR